MKQCIITEEQTKGIYDYFAEEDNDELRFAAYDILKDVLAHPYNPQAERDNVLEEVRTACIRDESVGCTIFRILQELRTIKQGEQG